MLDPLCLRTIRFWGPDCNLHVHVPFRSVIVLEDNDVVHLSGGGYGVYNTEQSDVEEAVPRVLLTLQMEVEQIMKVGTNPFLVQVCKLEGLQKCVVTHKFALHGYISDIENMRMIGAAYTCMADASCDHPPIACFDTEFLGNSHQQMQQHGFVLSAACSLVVEAQNYP